MLSFLWRPQILIMKFLHRVVIEFLIKLELFYWW